MTNAALVVLGLALIRLTLQLVAENDHYHYGGDHVSAGSLAMWLGAIAVLLVRRSNVDRYTFGIILGFALACRLALLFPEPFLSSDVYRYAWDGVVQHAGVNPYRYVPGDIALKALRAPNQDLFDNMNRRDYAHTIYPPVAQIVFYLVTWVNGSVTMMKLGMVLFEGLTLAGLVLLLRQFGVRREWTLVYAWCPLVIWEVGGSGHVDSVVMAFLTLAMLFRYRDRLGLTGVFLGAAVLTKFYPVVVFPALWRRWDWKMPGIMIAMAVASYSLYLSVGKAVFGFFGGYVQEEGMATGTRYFLLDWAQRTPGLHWAGQRSFVVFAGLVMGAITVWAWRVATPESAPKSAFLRPTFALAFALMLLFSPHYPWYIAWLLPMLVLMPNLPVLVYLVGTFYLRTTALAAGSGEPEFHLNSILYGWTLAAAAVEFGLRRVPAVRGWLDGIVPLGAR